jgi:microcystin degradation protein MlrC
MERKSVMRVAVAGLVLESVSFLPLLTGVEDFGRSEAVGAGIITRYRGTNTTMGGFIKGLSEAGAEIVPIVLAGGWAAGPASDAAFVHYVDRICDGLAAAGRLDGVLLHPHGAMATPTRLDPDREMVERVRAVIGRSIPLVVALDYHGNIDETWLKVANAIFGYHYSPHIDMAETGERAARCLVKTLRGEMKPVMAIAKPGVMVPSIFSATGMAPLSDIVAESIAMASNVKNLVDVSIFAGFSYADVPNCGFAVVAVADGDASVATNAAERLSQRIWSERKEMMHHDLVVSLEKGLDRASASAKNACKPIVVLEHADRENDSTHVLREVIKRGLTKVAVPYLCDPEAALAAAKAGVGAEITLEVGGRSSDRAGGPVKLSGKILFAGEKTYRGTGAVRKDNLIQLGQSAVIDAKGVVVIITSSKDTAVDLDPFIQFGLRVEDFTIIVLRSKTHFRAAYEPIAEEIIIVDTPDWGPADLSSLPYRHVPLEQVFPFCESQ